MERKLFFLFYVKISEDQINLFLRNKQVHTTSRAEGVGQGMESIDPFLDLE